MTGGHHPDDAGSDAGSYNITISHRKTSYTFEFDDEAELMDLFTEIAASLDIPLENQKIIVPKSPLLTWPLKEPHKPLRTLEGKKLMLMGSGAATAQAVQEMSEKVAKRNAARLAVRQKRKAGGSSTRSRGVVQGSDSRYTFLQIQPLRGLPHPERSEALLKRLKADPGIVATMKKHEFTVALLTEMEPLSNTQSSHEGTSRILGLNRNKGEAIELRLRTDAHDGYRDYKTIRKTLCHELAHNVHSDHDRNFWDLCHQIEREVDAADWKTGGRTIGETSAYHISGQADEDDDMEGDEDHGGWEGGEFVLGGIRDSANGMSRREILAKAAMERQKKDDQCEKKADNGWRPCQRPHRSDENE